MKPLWHSRKFWVSVLTLVGVALAAALDRPEIADRVVEVGMVLVAALGLEDLGKARVAMLNAPPPSED